MESLKLEADASERAADFAKVAEIRYGKIPELERQLRHKENRLKKKQISRILREEVLEGRCCFHCFQVDKLFPFPKMLEGEMEKLIKMGRRA